MKSPANRSATTDCAPKPIANAKTPAEAIAATMSIPSCSRMRTVAKKNTVAVTSPLSRIPIVSARCVALSALRSETSASCSSVSFPSLRTTRADHLRPIRFTINATRQITTMLRGVTSSQLAASATSWFPVQS